MELNEIFEKEYYMVDCYDFIYFPRIVHIVGVGSSGCDEGLQYYINILDNNKERLVYKSELERFKTFNEAKKYAEYLNNIPENKKRAKQWNEKDKFILMQYVVGEK